MAEEGGAAAGGSGVTWLVAPLDGTINYLWAIPQWSVSIAARDERGGLVGVVHDPSRGETFSARRGHGVGHTDRGPTFFVVGKEGPLSDGELERARAWGATLAARA